MSVCSHPAEHRPAPHQIDTHHVLPRSWGGLDVAANRVELCANCHHNTHRLLDAYVTAGGDPGWPVRRHYTATERTLAARAWDEHDPTRPTPMTADRWSA